MSADLSVRVVVETDGSAARVLIPASFDVSAVNASRLAEAAAEAGVRMNDAAAAALARIAEQFQNAPAEVNEVFAVARPARHGGDGELIWQPGFEPKADDPGAHETNHAVDHYAGNDYIHVRQGDHVATVQEGGAGENGETVTGEVLKARPGGPCPVKPDSSFRIDEQQRIIAAIDGTLQLAGGTLSITKLLEIRGFVDFETGHIDFDGSVDIREGVRDRFIVKATGNVRIGGLVESATIACGGNLHCHRGVAARERGSLTVEGDADFGFLNNARGMICGSLTVRKEVINCEIAVGGDLLGEAASLIGGVVVAGANVCIGTLGSNGTRATVLRVGIMPVLAGRLAELDREAAEQRTQLDRKRENAETMERFGGAGRRSASEQTRMTDLRQEIDEMQRSLNSLDERRAEIQSTMAQPRKISVRVGRCIHPAVRIECGADVIEFDRAVKGPIELIWDEQGELTFQIADGPGRPITEIAGARLRTQTGAAVAALAAGSYSKAA